ncbi:MAG: helix-turn-helix domain-containing protein [Deinococcota bacterium]
MKVTDSSSPPDDIYTDDIYVVQTPAQARLLTDPIAVEFFKPFLAAEKTVQEVTLELDTPISTVYYRVKQLVTVGLLKVAREQARSGRAIKYYTSIKPNVFIPFALTPYATLEEGIHEQLSPVWRMIEHGLAHVYSQTHTQGRKLMRDEHGTVLTSLSSSLDDNDVDETPAYDDYYSDLLLKLAPKDAHELATTLREICLKAYQTSLQNQTSTQQVATKQYMLQVALVPTD